ncbi:MAG: rod-binding protein [Novosphingobium sp.]|nr:rod-binding protein [Novosphingobium sp.]MCP5401066.1 rod-binding protein [Novosphingobium sp.]
MIPIESTTTSLASLPAGDREKLAAAAKQFEAIFVRQMLSAARKADFGEDIFGGQAMDTFRQMQDERFADIASDTGAFGLAAMLEAQLARHLPKEG